MRPQDASSSTGLARWRCWSPASRSFYASSHPDGLEYVAEQDRLPRHGRRARRPPTARSPTTRPRASTTTRLSGGSPASPASLLVLVLGGGLFWALRRRRRPRRRRTPTRGADGRWAPGTATGSTSTATAPSTGLRRTSSCSPWSASCSSWWPRRATGTPPSRSTLPLLLGVVARLAGAAGLPRQADGGRGAVRAVRAAGAVRGARARRSRCSASASPSPAWSRPGACSSRARSACSPR